MANIVYSLLAKSDLKQIARFIAKDKPNAARQWVKTLKKRCEMLSTFPEIGDDRNQLGSNLRSTYVGAYVIFFRRIDSRIEIVRILHGSQDILN